MRGWYGPTERSLVAAGNFAIWVEAIMNGGLFLEAVLGVEWPGCSSPPGDAHTKSRFAAAWLMSGPLFSFEFSYRDL